MQDKILLLNASNLGSSLVYPYAFIQISEIASRYGIEVFREDLFGIEFGNWKKLLTVKLSQNDFKAIFITIRNTDTLGIHEYPPENIPDNSEPKNYFPLFLAKKLIEVLREISMLPIVIGGFGFSVLPNKILQFVKADFGVFGGPEGVFENFHVLNDPESVENVPNLYYISNDVIKSGPRKFYGPAKTQEYTEILIKEIKEFISRGQNNENLRFVSSIAVEISRGCPHSCSFCAEPVVKGHSIQYRSIGAIIDDLRLLQKNGFYEIFFVCSELNPLGNDFVKILSERIYEINLDFDETEKIKWYATYLMNFTVDEFNSLKKSGFNGGWYDVISLEDENLKNNNAPYNSEEILKTIFNLDGGLKGAYILEDEILTLSERIYYEKPKTHTGSFFLGNPKTTISTIRETLQNANKYRLDTIYDKTGINYATRIFDYINLTKNELRTTYSINFEGALIDYNDLYPSFTYPPDLLKYFGSPDYVREFFTYIQTTFLSSEYLYNINWQKFIQENLDLEEFYHLWLETDVAESRISEITVIKEIKELLKHLNHEKFQKFYSQKYLDSELIKISALIETIIKLILVHNNDKVSAQLKFLKLPENILVALSEPVYDIMKKIYTTFNSINEIIEFKDNQIDESIGRLFVEYFWMVKNIKFLT